MKKIRFRAAWVLLGVFSLATLAGGTPPPRPSCFYGTVTAGSGNAPVGTLVSAWINGVKYAEATVFTADGLSVYQLDVPGDLAGTPAVEGGQPGQTIVFKVGAAEVQNAAWQDGSMVRADLAAPIGPDLTVSVDDGVTTATPGATLTYTITVINHGPGAANGVALRDTLSSGTTFVSAGGGGSATGGVVTWPVFNLTQGQTAVRTVTARMGSSFPASLADITNVATVADDGTRGLDPHPGDNTDSDVDVLDAHPDLVVSVDNGASEILPGQRLEYRITVANNGTRDATGIVLRDTLPTDITFFAASDSGVEAAGVITWPTFSLAAGASVTRSFTARVNDPLSASVTSLVSSAVATEASGTDSHPGDNTAADLDPVVQKPDLTAASVGTAGMVTDPQSLAVSGNVAVAVANGGNLDLSDDFDLILFEDRDGDGLFTAAADNLLGQKNVTGPVPSGGSTSVAVPVSGGVLFRGSRLSAFVDSGLAVAESSETNNVGHSGQDCGNVPAPGDFVPVLELNWPRPGIVEPTIVDSASSPVVIDLDGNGVPDVVFTTSNLDPPLGVYEPSFLRAIRGDTGEAIFDVQSFHDGFRFWEFALATVAAGDVDLDGKPEIITANLGISVNGEPVNAITAYEHDGRRKWRSPVYSTHPQGRVTNRDNPTIADIDRNGVPEIIVGAHVFNNNGTLRWKGTGGQAFQSIFNGNGPASGAISLVADLDLTGNPEIVTGNTAYRSDGSIYWQIAQTDGYPAVANFDEDPFPEIVVVSQGKVRLHEHDGTLIWGPVTLPGRTPVAGGPPTVADFDADGQPEIGVAGSDFYTVFETGGTVKWQRSTQDFSSGMTGSTVFDFDGDGRFEVVYRDEAYLRVYRGEDGTVLFQYPVPSTTLNEQPTVADVDLDGNAEILVTADHGDTDSGVPGNASNAGLRVFGDANDKWVGTRSTWNQHAYSVGNVNDNGTIPRDPDWSWLSHNTYRAQIAPPGTAPFSAPDVTASYAVMDLSAYPVVTVTVRVGNGGGAAVKTGLPVAFYDEDGGPLLGVKNVSKTLRPGEYEDVSFTWTETGFADRTVVIAADDDGAGHSRDTECDEANNRYAYTYDASTLGLTLAMSDGQTAVGAGETFTYNLTVLNAANHQATGVALTDQIPAHTSLVAASDGGTAVGGTVTWPPFSLASGATASRSLTLLVSETIPTTVTELTNQAAVTDDGSHGPDPTPANNSATDTNRVSSVRAEAGGPYTGDEGVAIPFDASGSTDRDGTIVSYAWDLDNDGQLDDGSGVTISKVFPDEGSYTVSVKATGNSGESDTDTAAVTVRNVRPSVEAGPDRNAIEGDSVTLTATTFTDPGTTDTHTATINWGDGTPIQNGVVTESNGSGSVAGGHTYPDNGSFTVTVCVKDNDDPTATCDSFPVAVANANPAVAPSGTVDLKTWKAEAYSSGSATWNVAADGQSVVQTLNGNPAFFYGDFGSFGVRLEGKIRTTDTDDDFMGFVLGFRPGDTTNPNADFLLVDWKGGTQSTPLGGCFGSVNGLGGLAVSRVRGIPALGAFWGHLANPCTGGSVTELARGRTRGNTPWVRGTTYTFTFESTATSLKVWVDGTLEIDITGSFSPGRFAFYNYSQAAVTYSALSTQNLGGEEGSALTARGTFTDVGLRDTHTASLGWGDGSTTPGTVTQGAGSGAGTGSVTGVHTYQDDGSYTLNLCVTDDDGGTGCSPIPVTVLNVAPTVNAGPDRLTYSGEDAVVEGVTFADPGVVDTHTATIDWGDGTVTSGTVAEINGSGTVAGTHAYATDGTFTVKVCATDDGNATGCDSFVWQRFTPVLDLRLTKTASLKFARPNQNVTYTLTVANLGTREPRGVVLSDTLPDNLTFVSASNSGVWNAATRTITWTLGTVAYQQTLTRTVVARVVAAPPFNTPAVNTAQVADDGRFGPDATPADNTASATVILWDALTPYVDAGADRSIVEGDVATLAAPFNDTTSNEAHTATIDWGDGAVVNGTLSGSATAGVANGTHAYPEQGSFVLRVCVKDAANRTGCDEAVVTVANGAPRVNDEAGVDLRRWTAESYGTGPNWAVSADGKTVTQTINSVPAIFYGDFPAFGNRIEGTIRVLTASDDDFIGFVLGFVPGDTTNPNADYLLVDWKKQDQGPSGQAPPVCGVNLTALRGLAVSRVRGIPNEGEFWHHRDGDCNGLGQGIEELARGITLSHTGWVTNTDYKLTFEFSATRLQVFVNGTLELDVAGDFRNGRLGFYNASQEQVRYSSFTLTAKLADEGQPVEIGPTFGDPGVQDTHTATLEWGDGDTPPGTPAILEQGTGFGTVRGTHTYGDNGSYTVKTCVTDDEGAAGCGNFPVSVRNVAPAVDAGPDRTAALGTPFTGDLATFTDPGFRDTHTATVNWGDGTPVQTGVVTGSNGAGTVSGTKTYTATGTRTVQVCVKDDDNAQTCGTLTITVVGLPALAATKTAGLAADHDGDGVPSPGDELLYTVRITNSGGGSASDVVLTDAIPSHTRVVAGSVSSSAGTVVAENPVRVEIGSVGAAGTVTVTFRVTVGAPVPAGVHEVSNQGAVTSRELPAVLTDDPALGGASDPTVTMITAAPKLVAEKSAFLSVDTGGDGTPSPGDTLEYRLSILNTGNTSATGVALEDAIPPHTALVPGSVQASVGTVESEEPVRVAIGEIAGGERVEVTFRVEIEDPIATGVREVRNQGTVTSAELPPVLTDDPAEGGAEDPTVTAVSAAPALRVEKTDHIFEDADEDGAASPGDAVLYRVTVTNSGNTGATGVVLTDPVPANASLIAGTVQTSQGTVESEDPVRVAIGDLAAGATATVSFQVRVDEAFPHTATGLSNQALLESGELEDTVSDDPETPEVADPTRTPVFLRPGASIGDVRVTEGDSGTADAVFTVHLTGPGPQEVRVDYATAAVVSPEGAAQGTDYQASSGTLTFAPGEVSKTVVVKVAGDLLLEADETFAVTLANATGAEIGDGSGIGTIADDEACPSPNLLANPGAELPAGIGTIPGWRVVEGAEWQTRGANPQPAAGTAYFYAGRTAGAELVQDVDVSAYASRIGSSGQIFAFEARVRTFDEQPSDVARIVVEYRDAANAVVLDAFDSGEIASPLEWRRVADARPAPAGTRWIRVRLLASRFEGVDNDGYFDALVLQSLRTPVLTVDDVAVDEGDSGTTNAPFPVRLSCPVQGDVTVVYTTMDGSALAGEDYTVLAPATLVLLSGSVTRTIAVPVVGDTVPEPNETFKVLLSDPQGAVLLDPQATGTIRESAVCPEASTIDYRGYTASSCAVPQNAVTVHNQAELNAYLANFGFDGSKVRNVIVNFNPTGEVMIVSPCEIRLKGTGAGGFLDINAEKVCLYGRKGVTVAEDHGNPDQGIDARAIKLVSEEGSAGFSKGLALTADTTEIRALKEAKVGLDCDVAVTGALTIVSTGDLSTSEALIRQDSSVTAGSILVEASRGATLGPSTVIDVTGGLVVRSTGTAVGSVAKVSQSAHVTAGTMDLTSGNKVTVEQQVTLDVTGRLTINAGGTCSIAATAAIHAGSTSGSCLP